MPGGSLPVSDFQVAAAPRLATIRAAATVTPDTAAQASASPQPVPGAAGFRGGSLPRAAFHAASTALRVAIPVGMANASPTTFQPSFPAAPATPASVCPATADRTYTPRALTQAHRPTGARAWLWSTRSGRVRVIWGFRVNGTALPYVPPGTGWPGDPAGAGTPVAASGAQVARLAAGAAALAELDARVSVCRACPRLVSWREEVAVTRRAAFADQVYWGRPAPGFGPVDARIAVLGLAPAAHGANRTGRVFTGDRSGDWLYAALFRAGLANQPTSVHAADGLALVGTRIMAAVRCAPPANKPTPAERDTCRPWLVRELQLLAPTLRTVVVLGAFGWQALWPALAAAGLGTAPTPRPAFTHGAMVTLGELLIVGCYHVSQQNTFTGKLTERMLDAVFTQATRHAAGGG
jgi:uracil-DNA glycosylase